MLTPDMEEVIRQAVMGREPKPLEEQVMRSALKALLIEVDYLRDENKDLYRQRDSAVRISLEFKKHWEELSEKIAGPRRQ